MRSLVHRGMLALRQSGLRRPIIGFLVRLHNFSYHLISFFASHTTVHPKHDILRYHDFFLSNIAPTERVLDVGSGKGEVAYSVSQKAKEVVGIDIEPRSVAQAKKNYRAPNLTFQVGDATTQAFPEPFDTVILSNVLEHIKHRPEFLRKLAAVAPKILIRVPMITRDWITVYKKNEGFEYRLDDTHYIEYDLPTFEQEMAAAGLTITHYHVNFGELYAVTQRS